VASIRRQGVAFAGKLGGGMKTKRKRWVCPQCQHGLLAPSRPRRDDVRRYCLNCSKKTGRLVERLCPTLEKKREKTAARHAVKRQKKAAKIQTDPKHQVMKLFRKWKKLRCWKDDVAHATLDLRVKRDTRKWNAWFTPGRARYFSGRITMTIGTDWADTRATLLHELTHVTQGRRPGTSGHDDGFRSIYREAIDELLGDHYMPSKGGLEHMHALHCDVAEAFRRMDAAQVAT
jgi:hypothetical protein